MWPSARPVNLLLVCFWRPLFLLGVMGIAASGIYLFNVRKQPIVLPEGRVLSRREVLLSYGGLSLLQCFLFGGSRAFLGLAVAALLVLLHSSFRQRSLKSKVNVGLSHMLGGAGGKNEEGADDTGGAADEENPPSGSFGQSSDAALARLSASRSAATDEAQANNRSAFRASMRQKYLKKG